MRLRSRCGGGRIVPQRGEIAGQGGDPLVLGGGELAGGGVACLLVGVGRLGHLAHGGVPVGLQGIGHEPVGRVNGQVTAAGQVGVVAGTLHGGGAEPVGVGGAGGKLVGDAERGLKRHGGQGGDKQGADGSVDARAGDALADGGAMADPLGLAHILGHPAVGSSVVAHRHRGPADTAQDQALHGPS
jgi:hypothetical protein